MQLEVMPGTFAVRHLDELPDARALAADAGPVFLAVTDQEISLVCPSAAAPLSTSRDGWAMLRVLGPLDFDLVGILATLTTTLASANIPVFATSTYLTDYLLVPADRLGDAVAALGAAGHAVVQATTRPSPGPR
ncbi:MAG: ACT domain-containing protein [Propionibacteriaceae bacterium]|nr:ACT domain-containing protein [Propionibacteriaceae bacterium]